MSTPLEEKLTDIRNQLGILDLNLLSLEAEIDNLKRQGTLDGHAWYKGGKYLYLVHHADQSKEYIGTDPEKQREALARISRYQEWQIKNAKLNNLHQRKRDIENTVDRAWRTSIGK